MSAVRVQGNRARLADFLYRSRLLGLCRFLSQERLIVFTYHRIQPEGSAAPSSFDDGVFGPTVSEFEQQVRWLRDHTRIVSEEELIKSCSTGRRPRGVSTMITFDDGYRDTYTLAYPILKRLGVPAMLFVPTRPITARQLGWWDLIAYLLKKTAKPSVSFDGMQLSLINWRTRAIRMVQRQMHSTPAETTQDLLGRLAAACEVALPEREIQDRELMTWDHIREVAAHQMAIGSHGHTHRVLATLDPASQREELVLSKQVLEREIGRPVRAFAYPVGGYHTFTAETQRLARDVGYHLGFSFNTFVNEWACFDPFDVKRMMGPELSSLAASMAVLPGLFARRAAR